MANYVTDHAAQLWTALRRHSDELNGRPLQLLIGPSADAACAARSLTHLMKSSRILYDGHPVSQLQHVRELARTHIENAMDDDQTDVYIFVGCGACVDVTSLLDMTSVAACFIIDAQRPMHLANLRHPKVTVWNPEHAAFCVTRFFAYHARRSSGVAAAALRRNVDAKKEAGTRRKKRSLKGAAKQRARKQPGAVRHDDASNDGSDNENPDAPATRYDDADDDDFSHATSSSDDDDDAFDDSDDDGESKSGSEGRSASPEADIESASDLDADSIAKLDEEDLELGPAGQRIDWRGGAVPPKLERLYYSSRWFDQSAAMCIFDLATSVGQRSDAIVWNASVGVADLVRRRGLTNAAYAVEHSKLLQAVEESRASRRTLHLGDVTNNSIARHSSWKLVDSTDDALFCLQHTSLLDALELDPVLAARLRIHRPAEGKVRVEELLAHVGVSQEKARREWINEFSQEDRKDIMRRLNEELLRLRIIDSSVLRSRRVIARATGFGAEVSPFDACTLFYAEATCPPSQRSIYNDPARLREHERKQFWIAADVLDAAPSSKAFGNALALAQRTADAISVCTAELFGKAGGVVAAPHLQYTLLGQGGLKVADELWHPTRLAMLAEHLSYALGAEHPRQKRRPVLIGCPMPSGVPGAPPTNFYTVACVLPDVLGMTDVAPIVGEVAAGRLDVDDNAVTQEHLDPIVTSANSHANALSFLEAVHLRLAR